MINNLPQKKAKKMALLNFLDYMEKMDTLLTIDKGKTRKLVKRVLNQYRKIKQFTNKVECKMTSTITPTPPSCTNLNHSFADQVEEKITFEFFMEEIDRSIDNLKLVNNDFIPVVPECILGAYWDEEYYRDLLRMKFLSEISETDYSLRKALAQKYQDHCIDYTNNTISKSRFYRDQGLALDAFAVAYRNGELLVYQDFREKSKKIITNKKLKEENYE